MGTCEKIQDINRMIVMHGSAKRQSVPNENILKSTNYSAFWEYEPKTSRRDFFKLRIPPRTNRPKKFCDEPDLMSKSCKILFEFLKPYEKTTSSKEAKVTTVRLSNKKKFLTTFNPAHLNKATKKVQFLSISEKSFNSQPLFTGNDSTSSFECNSILMKKEFNIFNFNMTSVTERLKDEMKMHFNFDLKAKTISSEDFINNVFLKSETALLATEQDADSDSNEEWVEKSS